MDMTVDRSAFNRALRLAAHVAPTKAVLPILQTVLLDASLNLLTLTTDDADEQGFGLFGVLGRLNQGRPEVSLRVGIYGYFFPLPWGAVFDGDGGNLG